MCREMRPMSAHEVSKTQSQGNNDSRKCRERAVTKLRKNERRHEAQKRKQQERRSKRQATKVSPQSLNMRCVKSTRLLPVCLTNLPVRSQILKRLHQPMKDERRKKPLMCPPKWCYTGRSIRTTEAHVVLNCRHNFVSVLHLSVAVLDQPPTEEKMSDTSIR